jgi:hypothetical protein
MSIIGTVNINDEVVKLEMLDRSTRLDYFKKLKSDMKGSLILECIVCNNCLTRVNPLCETVPVNKRNMLFGTKLFILLEPQCPVCNAFIPCETFFHIEN